MKILKKIGIGCIALVICFCSCFKFVNAESNFVYEPFNLINDSYMLYLSEDATPNASGYYLICYNNDYHIFLEIEDAENQTLYYKNYTTDSQLTRICYLNFLETVENFAGIYDVYTFTIEEDFSSILNDLYYEDRTISFFEFNENEENGFSVYDTIYNLIETYIFGGNIELGTHQDLTATILSSIICVLVFALPFLIIWKVIKIIMG